VVLTGSGSAAAVTFGPFAAMPICADISTDGGRVAFGLDTVALASVREDRFEVWNIATGRHEFTLIAAPPAFPDTRTNASCRIRFSPDGRRIATSGARVDVWETATGARRATDALQAGVNSQPIAFSGDSARLAIGRPNGLVAVLHLERSAATVHQLAGDGLSMDESIPGADRTLQTLLRRKREVLTVAFSRDGQTVVSGTSTAVGVWDVRQSKLVRVLTGHAFDVTGLAVTADGRWIYSADAGGVVRTWPASSAPAVVRIPGSSANLLPFSASADGTAILTTEPYGDTLATVRLADLHREFIRVETGKSQGLMRSAISPDGLRVFAVDDGGVIRRWTIGKGSVTVSTSLKSRVKSLVVSPTGTLLAFTDGNSVDVWDASMLKQLATVEMLQTPTELLFRDDETLIVLMESQQVWFPPTVLSIWNWRTNSVLAELDPRPLVGSDNVLWRFALSPTGRRIALILHKFGTPSTVSIWDSDLKAEVGRLPPGDYAALAFSHDGRRIVSVGSEENAVRVWDAERFRLLLTLPDTDSHRGGVAFTRAGQIIAGRTGGGFTIWDTQIRQR
jgi:WD40 repeat protein